MSGPSLSPQSRAPPEIDAGSTPVGPARPARRPRGKPPGGGQSPESVMGAARVPAPGAARRPLSEAKPAKLGCPGRAHSLPPAWAGCRGWLSPSLSGAPDPHPPADSMGSVLTHCPTTAADWLTGRGSALRTTFKRHRASTSGSSEDLLATQLTPNCGESASSRGVLGTVPPDSEADRSEDHPFQKECSHPEGHCGHTHPWGGGSLRDRVLVSL